MKISQDLAKHYGLTEAELHETMSSYVPENLGANQFFIKQGEVSDRIAFVRSGLLRAFFYDDFANEITTQFYPENSLIISFESFNNQVPCKENIIAIEDSVLMVVSYKRQKELYQLIPAWNHICKDLADMVSREMIDRAAQFQTLTATERYHKFCNDHPHLLQRINLGYIASYIGVDTATLSRIRKKK